jgi:hypothetical protein
LVIVSLCILAVPAVIAQAYTANLGAFDLVLVDDFHNNNNYIGYINSPELMNGHRIQARENWTLRYTFTVSRDLEDELLIGFLDRSPGAGFWFQLSWDDARRPPVPIAKLENVRAGQTYSGTMNITTIARATGASAAANSMVWITEGTGTRRQNGGARGNVTIHFTEFVLTRQ